MPPKRNNKIRAKKIGKTIFGEDAIFLECSRCGHTWKRRGKTLPEKCSNLKCKSPYWNNERVRNVDDNTWLVTRSWSKESVGTLGEKHTVDDEELTCQCCGYTWQKRLVNELPRLCPNCRNTNWNYIKDETLESVPQAKEVISE